MDSAVRKDGIDELRTLMVGAAFVRMEVSSIPLCLAVHGASKSRFPYSETIWLSTAAEIVVGAAPVWETEQGADAADQRLPYRADCLLGLYRTLDSEILEVVTDGEGGVSFQVRDGWVSLWAELRHPEGHWLIAPDSCSEWDKTEWSIYPDTRFDSGIAFSECAEK